MSDIANDFKALQEKFTQFLRFVPIADDKVVFASPAPRVESNAPLFAQILMDAQLNLLPTVKNKENTQKLTRSKKKGKLQKILSLVLIIQRILIMSHLQRAQTMLTCNHHHHVSS
ncbi:MAG: hypothetical protein K2X98_04880 [Alphaproteobacteria bacterium]|nr:hypothetical protein [Alphaproteobacteria bacterium]